MQYNNNVQETNSNLQAIATNSALAATAANQALELTALNQVVTATAGQATATNQSLMITLLTSLQTLFNTLLGKDTAATSTISISSTVTTTSVNIMPANVNRKGLYIYNNSSNSGYLSFGSPANSNTNMTVIIASFTTFAMPKPIYTGAIHAIRNAGTGTFLLTELT